MNTTLGSVGALALAGTIAIAGCQATQTRSETDEMETASEAATETDTTETTVTAAAPADAATAAEPTGLGALAGRWTGRWGGQSVSTLTVVAEPASVNYCFKGECWDIEEFTFAEGTLGWSWKSSVFEFTLKGETLRGKLKRSQGTHRITMKRR